MKVSLLQKIEFCLDKICILTDACSELMINNKGSYLMACFATTSAFFLQFSFAAISMDTVPVSLTYVEPEYDPLGYGIIIRPGYYEAGTPRIGDVFQNYRIGTYEVTNSQYRSFLNAVDPDGTNQYGIYNSQMTSNQLGGINFDQGLAKGAKYSLKAGMENKPVNFVSWYDAARFTNWMSNGSRILEKSDHGFGFTEAGAYDLLGSSTGSFERNSGTPWWLPSSSEWSKAAFYQPPSLGGPRDGLWYYATQSDVITNIISDPDSGHSANFHDGSIIECPPNNLSCAGGIVSAGGIGGGGGSVGIGYLDPRGYSAGSTVLLTEVGKFGNSSSFYGTYDQAGNVQEWTEGFGENGGAFAAGGAYDDVTDYNLNVYRPYGGFLAPETEAANTGFRVATNVIPEPTSTILAFIGACLLARRRR